MRHLFDTSSVRKLSSLSGKEWQTFRKAFRRAGFTSGWIPRVLGGELLGSNLHRKDLTVEGLRDLQGAVGRMNKLTEGVVLPDDIELAQRSIYDLARVPYPPDAYQGHSQSWPPHVRRFLSVRDPATIRTEEADGRLLVTMDDAMGPGTLTIQLPRDDGFVEHAHRVTALMREEVAENPTWGVANFVADRLPARIAGDAKEFGIPDEVAEAALRNVLPLPDESEEASAARYEHLTQHALIYRMSCECAYYFRRATNKVEPRPPERNDSVDLSLTSYLTPGTVLVVEEKRLRHGVLAQVMRPGAYCTFDELRGRLGLMVS